MNGPSGKNFERSFSGNFPALAVVNERGGFDTMRDPFLAGFLSFLVPGVGQLYNGRILAGILWLLVTPGFWIGSGGAIGWICHIVSAYCAYIYAKENPAR
jgi:TM2 domain-containing membrane protein YozV